jgi:hypothetical protein
VFTHTNLPAPPQHTLIINHCQPTSILKVNTAIKHSTNQSINHNKQNKLQTTNQNQPSLTPAAGQPASKQNEQTNKQIKLTIEQ